MNRLDLLFIVPLLAAALCSSCDNKNDEIDREKLLETVTYDNGNYDKYEYDEQSRITKISSYSKDNKLTSMNTLTYSGDDLVKEVRYNSTYPDDIYNEIFEYTKSENKITIEVKSIFREATFILDLDSDELPVKCEGGKDNLVEIFQIQNGNLMKFSYKVNVEYSYEYEYGNMKSPHYNCKTPKWYMFGCLKELASQNNVSGQRKNEGAWNNYEYVYDKDDYPTKCTEIRIWNNEKQIISITKFKYINKN